MLVGTRTISKMNEFIGKYLSVMKTMKKVVLCEKRAGGVWLG